MTLLIQWAVTSSALILILLAARRLFRDRLSARMKYALWGVVLLRLLVPFQIELPAPVSNSLPVVASNLAPEVGQWEERSIPVFPQGRFAVSGFSRADLHQLEPGEIIPTETSMGYWQRSQDGETVTRYLDLWSPAQIAAAVWGCGAVLAALIILLSNLRFGLRLRKRRKPLEGADAPVPIYTAEGLPSPCLFGVFRPAVYLNPWASEHPSALSHILAHELTHYRHKDHVWSLLRCLALALHWYNPLVWLAVILSKRDGELACDEGAVARLGEGERVPYGRTLVDMVAARSLRPVDLLSCSTAMTGGGKSIKHRVARLAKHPKTAKAALFAAVAVAALATVFVFAERAQPKANTMFHDQLELADSIRYSPPLYSSQIYPSPIADEDLLAAAKEALAGFAYLPDAAPRPDLEEELIHTSYVVLINNSTETEYTLLWQDGYSYLLPGNMWEEEMKLQKEHGEGAHIHGVSGTMRGPAGVNAGSVLEDLARQQWYRASQARDTELEENHLATSKALAEALESCACIRFEDGTPDITDPALLAQAGKILTSGYLIDDLSQTGAEGDNESIELRGKDGQRLSSFLITNQAIRRQLHELAPDDQNHQLLGDLTQEQVDRANEAFASFVQLSEHKFGNSEISCFFTSSYDDPTQIDLEEFLRYCPIGIGNNNNCLGEDDRDEFLAVMEKDNLWIDPERELSSPEDLPVPVHRYPRSEVSALLQKYAGVTVEELDWESCLYVEEYDAFYNFTSDAGPGFFECAGGQVAGDSVLLWSAPLEDGTRSELTLRKSGDRWLIQSFHLAPMYER